MADNSVKISITYERVCSDKTGFAHSSNFFVVLMYFMGVVYSILSINFGCHQMKAWRFLRQFVPPVKSVTLSECDTLDRIPLAMNSHCTVLDVGKATGHAVLRLHGIPHISDFLLHCRTKRLNWRAAVHKRNERKELQSHFRKWRGKSGRNVLSQEIICLQTPRSSNMLGEM